MKQLTTLDKKQLGKPIVDNGAVMWLRDKIYPLLMLLSKTKVRYRILCINKLEPLPDRPIIFTPNHSAFTDTPIVLNATKRQSYIFAGKQRLASEDMLFFTLNGSIWVDRKDKNDMQISKEALISYLKKGRSVLWFPEGTWNLTENMIMLPMKWGIIDIARESGAQIIPMALDYDRKNLICNVNFSLPLLPPANREDGIHLLRDTLSTLRWELWERNEFAHLDKLIPRLGNAFLLRQR